MRDRTGNRRVFLGRLVMVLLPVLAGGCADRDRRPPGLRLLQEKRAKMIAGMTVNQVQSVMTGHPWRDDTTRYTYADDRVLPRPCALARDYGDHVGAGEGSYGLTAFFDEDGKLMDTSIGKYSN